MYISSSWVCSVSSFDLDASLPGLAVIYSDLVTNLLLDGEVASHYFSSRDQDRVWR